MSPTRGADVLNEGPYRYPNETREMRLFSRLIAINDEVNDESLAQFIANRRIPLGTFWRTWEELVFDLASATGELVTDGSLRKWAKRYGIPEYTTADASSGPKPAEFRRICAKVNISV